MDLRQVSSNLGDKLCTLFDEVRSGLAAREDSRAFGAMVEKRIADQWDAICSEFNYEPLARPGRRTIFDFAFRLEGRVVGVDIKTKDLDVSSYSDGGICAVGNLLKYLANDRGVFLIAEFGHNNPPSNPRDATLNTSRWHRSLSFPSTPIVSRTWEPVRSG